MALPAIFVQYISPMKRTKKVSKPKNKVTSNEPHGGVRDTYAMPAPRISLADMVSGGAMMNGRPIYYRS